MIFAIAVPRGSGKTTFLQETVDYLQQAGLLLFRDIRWFTSSFLTRALWAEFIPE